MVLVRRPFMGHGRTGTGVAREVQVRRPIRQMQLAWPTTSVTIRGLYTGIDFQGYNPALQACNQKRCDAVTTRRQTLLQQTSALPGPTWTGAYPVYNQYPQNTEMRADTQIKSYFSLVVAPGGNACH